MLMYTPGPGSPWMAHEDEMGTNAPFIHQRTIAALVAGLYPLYHHDKTIALEPFPEMMLDEGYNTPTRPPIISIFRHF
ncbi:hypothetical protein GCM10023187_34120 [Nibrella viscosa]|uniref:Phytanoyl-CoA dioxygenase n=1 Tax=Nibrella viscosa TaxID=1084524 RepID=A0ABP8KM94_9BACT